MTVVVGTAGHIDHGKTTLLRALTGIDTDRLPEEQRRGMTIDIGYAHLALDDWTEIDFVDVPGHDRLIGNMLVGAGEIDAAMLVVAADDGPRAQTLEHLELLDALGIADGIAVVTKADAVGANRAAEVAATLRTLLDRTVLRGAPVIVASGVTGDGLGDVRAALVELRDALLARPMPSLGGPRLAVDRSFSVRGRGAVVTGSLRGGPIDHETRLRLVPGGATVRIRGLQVHGHDVGRAEGGRTAINLAGVEAATIQRGAVLTGDRAVVTTDRVLVALRPATSLSVAQPSALPADRARVQVHVGTARVEGSVGRSGRDTATLPDGEIAAILRLAGPVAIAPGDRFVLRRPSPGSTLAGGRVLDVEPARGASRRRTTPERLAALAAAAPRSAAWHVARLDLHGAASEPASRLAPDASAWLDGRIVALVEGAPHGVVSRASLRGDVARELRHRVTLDPAAAANFVSGAIEQLVATTRLAADGDRLLDPRRVAAQGPSPELSAAMDRLEQLLDGPAPPPLGESARRAACPPSGVRALESAGRIVVLGEDLAYAASAYRALERKALALATAAPLTPAALRDATGTSRKYVMAILEDLGRRGVLRRTPDGHVPGPRAAIEVPS